MLLMAVFALVVGALWDTQSYRRRVNTPSLTDQIAQASASSVLGKAPLEDDLGALLDPMLDPWEADPADSNSMDPWLQTSPQTRVATDTSHYFTRQPVTFVYGDEKADVTASRRNVNLQSAGWLDIARSQLGVPYVWATANPAGAPGGPGSGFDCSGLTQWVYKRAFGVTLPHSAAAQQQQLQRVGRDQLQPGDLLFFAIPGGNWKGPNTASHVGIYIGGNKMIDASSTNDAVVEREVFWSYFITGGHAPGADRGAATTPVAREKRMSSREKRAPRAGAAAAAASMTMAGLLGEPFLDGPGAAAHYAALNALRARRRMRGVTTPSFGEGTKAEIKEQLYEGFMDAGAPELAKMVKTKAFDAWIGAESGWQVDSASRYYPGHGRNYGLFQFWEGHAWTSDYLTNPTTWTASAYEQAKLVVRYFDLTPEDIRRYAAQVQNDTYGGWG